MKYRAIQGDVLDAICTRYYGLNQFDLAAVYAANKGLADLGVVIPAGAIIELPKMQAVPAENPRVRLWD